MTTPSKIGLVTSGAVEDAWLDRLPPGHDAQVVHDVPVLVSDVLEASFDVWFEGGGA